MIQRLSLLLAVTISVAACGTSESTQSTETIPEQKPAMTAGQKLFINNCIQCHNIKTDKTGPKLEGVLAKWDNDTARVRAFIYNSPAVIKAGDPRAVAVFEQWNKTMMTPMTHLSDGEIDQILEYINAGVE